MKDCEHPFRISLYPDGGFYAVDYYSSKQIKNNQLNYIGLKNEYNQYVYKRQTYKILDEYPSGEDYEYLLIKNFSILHEEMKDTTFKFKFAD